MKIDEKVQALTAVQDMDKFMEANAEELPFVSPEADQNAGFIKIEPPVDFSEFQTDKKLEITMEQPEEKKPEDKEADKSEQSEEKKPEKKESVKDKLAKGKEKSEKTKAPKKIKDKDLQEAI